MNLTSLFNIFRALTWRYYRGRPGRFLLCVLGLCVGVAVAGAINLTNDRVIRSFRSSMDTIAGNANLRLRPEQGLAPEDLKRLYFLWEHGSFSPYAVMRAAMGNQVVRLYGFDFISDGGPRRFAFAGSPPPSGQGSGQSARGGAPQAESPAAGLIVSEDSVLGKKGDRVRLIINARVREFRVTGVLKAINGRLPARNAAFLDISRLLEIEPKLTGVDIQVSQEKLGMVRSELRQKFPGARVQTISERRKITTDMLSAFQANLQALGIIALLVSAYLVYNTMNISVLQRDAMIGSLFSLGADRRQVFAALMGEGLLLGILGGIPGTILAWALSLLSFQEVSLTLENVFRLDPARGDAAGPASILYSFLGGLAFAAFAAWYPAWKGSRMPAAQARKAGRSEYNPRKLLMASGIALVLLILFVCFYQLAHILRSIAPGYMAVAALVGVLSFTAPGAVWLMSRLTGMAGGGASRLAAAAAREHVMKIAVAAAALGIALSMAGAVTTMVSSFRVTVADWLEKTIVADIYIKSRSNENALVGTLDPVIPRTIEQDPRVRGVMTIRTATRLYRGSEITVGANEFHKLYNLSRLSLTQGTPQDILRARDRNGIFISEVFANRFIHKRGDIVNIAGHALPVMGVFRSYSSQRGFVLMDAELYGKIIAASNPRGVAVFLKKDVDSSRVMLDIRKRLSGFELLLTLSRVMRGRAMDVFDQTFRLTYALQAIAGGIAALAVITTLLSIALERRRDFATLRALGARDGALSLSMLLEALIITGSALLIAAVGSLLLSALLIFIINRYSFGWTIVPHVPALRLAAMAAGILALSVPAALYPMRYMRRANIARVLKSE